MPTRNYPAAFGGMSIFDHLGDGIKNGSNHCNGYKSQDKSFPSHPVCHYPPSWKVFFIAAAKKEFESPKLPTLSEATTVFTNNFIFLPEKQPQYPSHPF